MEPEVVIQLVKFYKGSLTQKRVLEVSRTTYNRWLKKMPSNKCKIRKVRPKCRRLTWQPLNIVENILNVDFNASRPLEKLSTDITYLPFGKSMLYLSSIMDLYNREIIAYTISDKQDLDCVLDTLDQVPHISENCILHSDQGSVYTARSYQMKVKEKALR